MKKFAAIAAVCCIFVVCFCVGASAALFSDSTIYSSTLTVDELPNRAYPATAFSCYKFEVLVDGAVIFSYGFDEETLLVRSDRSGSNLAQPWIFKVVDGSVDLSSGIYSAIAIPQSATFVFYSTVQPSIGTVTTIVEPAAVGAVSSRMFSIGDSIITFVKSHWIPLLALSAFVLVFCTQGIRKLIKGV